MIGLSATPHLEVELDWRAYYAEFCSVHGGDPVIFEGRLLFRDGWTHSRSDHRGPEWGPPQDGRELRRLVTAYWTRRRHLVEDERQRMVLLIEEMRLLAIHRSADLQRRVAIRDEVTGRQRQGIAKLDIEPLRGRLEWLEAEVRICNEQLREINSDVPRADRQAEDVSA